MNYPETVERYSPDKILSQENGRLATKVEHYSFQNERQAKIITLTRPTIRKSEHIVQIGQEIYPFFKKDNPNFNSEADYCIDFRAVQFASSKLLGTMIIIDKQHYKHRHKHLALCDLQPEVHERFKETKLINLFSIYDNPTEFLDSLLDQPQ